METQILKALEQGATVAGLHDEAWPGPPKPNPFLSVRLQREGALPRCSPQRELEFAALITRRLLASAPDVVVSYPVLVEDHAAEFARPNLDVYLQGLYHDATDLNVVFLCQAYEHKEWCGLEWRAIRDLIKSRREEVMLLRLDDAPVAGVFSIDGYIDINKRSNDDVAALILERHAQHHRPASSGAAHNGDRLVLHDHGKLPHGQTKMCELVLSKGERIHVALEAEHELDFAICTPATYKRWRDTAKLTGSLHYARRTSNIALTIAAKDSGKHHVLVINNTRRKNPVEYKLAIHEQ